MSFRVQMMRMSSPERIHHTWATISPLPQRGRFRGDLRKSPSGEARSLSSRVVVLGPQGVLGVIAVAHAPRADGLDRDVDDLEPGRGGVELALGHRGQLGEAL